MLRLIPQTRDEKIAMYLKCNKRELAEMLTTANEHIDRLTPPPRLHAMPDFKGWLLPPSGALQ